VAVYCGYSSLRFAVRLIDRALFVAQNSGISLTTVSMTPWPDFTAVADEIANGDLTRLQSFSDPFVESLVAPTQQINLLADARSLTIA